MRSRSSKAALLIWTALIFGFIFAPIASTVVFSFDADRFPGLPWAGFSLQWYVAVMADETLRGSFENSLIVATISAALATALGFAAAYVDYRYEFFGKRIYMAFAALPPTVPVVILGIAMLTFEARIGISGTLAGIIAGHVVLCAPFAMSLVRMRLADLDRGLEPAAWNLGARPSTSLRQIVLPHALPAIFAALFIAAAVSFDEYMIAWFVSGSNETLPVRVLDMLQGQVSPRINAVGSLIFAVSVPLVVLAQCLTRRRL